MPHSSTLPRRFAALHHLGRHVLLRLMLVWFSWAAPGFAEELQLPAPGGQDHVLGRQHVLFYEDADHSTLSQLLQRGVRFLPARERPQASPQAVHWLRLPLRNTAAVGSSWVLALGVPDTEFLEAYRVGGDGITPLLILRPDSGFAARPLPERMLGLPITLAAGERIDLYLRYRAHGDTPLSLQLQTPERFRHDIAVGNLFNGVVAGILLALMLFGSLQYLALHQPAFLAYVVMAGLMLVFMLQFEGYNFQYVWPNHGRWNQAAPVVLGVGMHLAHSVFAITLFDLPRQFPRLYRWYLAYMALPLLSGVLYLLAGWHWPLLIAALAYMPLALWSGVFFWRRGLPAASFFLLGATSYTLFTNLLFGLAIFSFIQSDISLFVYPKIGYLCEAVFFASALARQVQELHRRLEDGLRHHLAEAEQLARVESEKNRALIAAQQQQLQFAAAGHDLSQPLSSIRFALAALRAQPGGEPLAQHIDQSLDYTEALLRGMLDQARQSYAERHQALVLDDVFADVVRRHTAAAEQKGLQLRYHSTDLQTDGSLLVLTRILDNLLGNAIRYTPRGAILLGVRRRPAGLEIQVVDTGPGFDRARRNQLLAPFAQSGKLAEEKQGYGLGLHIVHALCVQSGYQLQIRSTPGKGSIFAVVVPYAAGSAEHSDQADSAAANVRS